jgi:hypothetical protein
MTTEFGFIDYLVLLLMQLRGVGLWARKSDHQKNGRLFSVNQRPGPLVLH